MRSAAPLALLATLATATAGAQGAKKPAPPKRTGPVEFKLEIEQDGKPVEIKDHEAYLRRGEFAILITFPGKESVHVSASFDASLYEDARAGRPFGNRFRSGLSGAEGLRNKDFDLYLSTPQDPRLHYWWVPDDGEKDQARFDELTRVGTGYRGRRTVRAYFLGPDKSIPVTASRRPLHLVLVQGEAKEPDYVVAERRREYLKLYFDAVPAATKEAVRADFELMVGAEKPQADREAALQRLAKQGRTTLNALDAIAAEARVRANEAAALADIRSVISAENVYSSSNASLYDTPDCLESPGQCIPKFRGQSFLTRIASIKGGYARTFHAGPAAARDTIKKAKASPSSLTSFAYTAVPEQIGESGQRSFCGDFTGKVCAFDDGAPPAVADGRCPTTCVPLP